ncbi:ketopantoate reductase family protein [Magnetofaba australis]|uniref:2-dehydropantoate 2-reductase n=1 Tax=Magnetofaba australis IT-1 TaxID=1434232 RepID=A0A1Y2K2L4_9PROT|nr:2-dehydropantoate 2-reductase [Magnetofaba australis]OSM01826.1 putative 2-dehydropantoate 2-reductase [Magnetofaba australis IT-1]
MTAQDPANAPASAPRILVVGSGAVGGFYGAKLAEAGAEVSLLCRSDFDVVRTQGLHIDDLGKPRQFIPHRVINDIADYPGWPDYMLVALKALPEIDVATMVAPKMGPTTTILLIQNGIETEIPLAEAFPDNELLSALAFICVSRTAPGCIARTDYGRLAMGRYPNGVSERAQTLGKLFEAAGVPCAVTDNVARARWRKLVWNAPFNPISVLSGGSDTLQMLEHTPTEKLIEAVMWEVLAIAEAAGCPLKPEVVAKNLADTRKMVPYKTSMLLDFEAGRPLEVEAILGNALRRAEALGIAAPHMASLHGLLSLLDANNRR